MRKEVKSSAEPKSACPHCGGEAVFFHDIAHGMASCGYACMKCKKVLKKSDLQSPPEKPCNPSGAMGAKATPKVVAANSHPPVQSPPEKCVSSCCRKPVEEIYVEHVIDESVGAIAGGHEEIRCTKCDKECDVVTPEKCGCEGEELEKWIRASFKEVRSYILQLQSSNRSLQAEVKVLREDRDKYQRVLEFLLYQSGHKDGNIGEAEMKLIEKTLYPSLPPAL